MSVRVLSPWDRARRLASSPQLWTRLTLAAAVAALLVAGFGVGVVIDGIQQGEDRPLMSVQFLAIFAFWLYAATGPLNGGWRYLPVTSGDRRTAAWVNVSLVPLLMTAIATFGGAACIALFQRPVSIELTLTLFGCQASLVEVFALIIILFGTWPDTVAWFMAPGSRKLGDWVLQLAFAALIGGGVFGLPALIGVPHIAAISTAAAFAMCMAALPLTLRVARLDRTAGRGPAALTLPSLHLRGWPGHLLGQALRAAAVLGGALILFFLANDLLVGQAMSGSDATDFRKGFMIGLGATPVIAPALLGVFTAMLSQQQLMRGRRLLLTLPRGGLLLLISPPFGALLVFVALMALERLGGVTPTATIAQVLTSALWMLALILLQLALSLRTTRYSEQFLNGLALAIPFAGAGFLSAMAGNGRNVPLSIGLLALTAAALLAASVVWCNWQLRRSRKPYSRWPMTDPRWRSS